jgi:hypothetical protein
VSYAKTILQLDPDLEFTQAGIEFFKRAADTVDVFFFLADTVMHNDLVAFVAQEALAGREWDEKLTAQDLFFKDPKSSGRMFRHYQQSIYEMFLVRTVENFQSYMASLMRQVLEKQPLILKTKEKTVSLEEIFSFSSFDELKGYLIDAKITSLSYLGLKEIQDWCSGRGIPIRFGAEQEEQLLELIATRNVIVHNRGIVDSRYAQVVGKAAKFKPGEERIIGFEYFTTRARLMCNVAVLTDRETASKFGLPLSKFQHKSPDLHQVAKLR